MPALIESLYLPQMLSCGFIPCADSNRDPEILNFVMDPSLGEGFCRVRAIGGSVAAVAMDIVCRCGSEIIYPQAEYLHLSQTMDKPGYLFGYVGRGETYHMICPCGQRMRSIGVSLMPEFYEQYLKTRYSVSPEALTEAVSELSGSVMLPAATSILKQLHRSTSCEAASRLCCEGKILELIAVVLDLHYKKGQFASSEIADCDKAAIGEVLAYLQEHYREPVYIGDLTRVACMCESKLAYIFKQLTGNTISKYICGIRMDAAKEFLADSDLEIEQIARMVGFRRHSSFAAAFRQLCEVTPSEYRCAQKELRHIMDFCSQVSAE
ncbi:MAG: AraC family transcriptional regulator [Clostridiales bacterium]|nr:AraC family transcriptional regulator [Clostridiales bacterium]